MKGDLECEGRIRLGPLPWDISERLAQFSGNWLEFSPQENAIIVRKSLPVGCPATTAVSCELITLLESLTPELRQAVPGGEIFVRIQTGRIMRFAVEGGEIRIQWPARPFSRPLPVHPDTALEEMRGCEAGVRGWARFAGASEKLEELRSFVARFDGLFPEEDMPSEAEQNVVFVRFRNAAIDPNELITMMKSLADPVESIEAELEVRQSGLYGQDQDCRIRIDDGQVQVFRPSP